MKHLLAGPPGSGKTTRILEEVRARLRAGSEDFRLVVPTSTMAEHLRNQLAREGMAFRGSLVATLAGFAKAVPEIPRPAEEAAVALALAEWLGPANCPTAFRELVSFPGFRKALGRALDDLATAGCDGLRLEALAQLGVFRGVVPAALTQAMEHVEAALSRRQEAFRAGHLAALASALRHSAPAGLCQVYLDGFFSLTQAELEVVHACADFASVTVSLPVWPGAESAIESLRRGGFRVENLHPVRPQPRESLVGAATREREVDEIARRILEYASQGRPWREMGVVLRRQEPYAPLLNTVFARFGIPVRFYFRRPLAAQPAVRFLVAIIEAGLAGWEHGLLLDALRQPVSAVSAQPDWPAIEATVRQAMPGRGLNLGTGLDAFITVLKDLELDTEVLPAEWSRRLRQLIPLLEAPPANAETAPWQSRAASVRRFYEALEETAALLPRDPVALARFWGAARLVLEATTLVPESAPRDAVHVLDVYEARQWELPVVFICGLLEGEFPLHPSPDPLLPDALRLKLRTAGIPVPLSSTRAAEELFYLDLARSRATDEVVLSWPQFDAKGDPTLRSFALGSKESKLPFPPRLRLDRGTERRVLPRPGIHDEILQSRIAARYAVQRPTWLESFLQCPFLFFGRHTLKLRRQPGGVEERLDPLALGSFVHELLSEWNTQPQDVEMLFDRRWAIFLRRLNIPAGWRPEFERLRLLRGLRRFTSDPYFREGWTVQAEKEVRLDLDGVRLQGRIDRYDQNYEGKVQVFDFKLSGDTSTQKRVKKSEEGLLVQAGLYALALQRLGLLIESVWFVPLRGTKRLGWESEAEIQELISLARTRAEEAQQQILKGIVAPKPADLEMCKWCEFRETCRILSARKEAAVTA